MTVSHRSRPAGWPGPVEASQADYAERMEGDKKMLVLVQYVAVIVGVLTLAALVEVVSDWYARARKRFNLK